MTWASDGFSVIPRKSSHPFPPKSSHSGKTENMRGCNSIGIRGRFGLQSLALLLLLSAWAPARADLHFSQPRVQRGIVRSGVPLAQRFDFVNQGPGAVTITDLRASCGCLAP